MKNIHKSEILDKFLGEIVSVSIFDGTKVRGTLMYDELRGYYSIGNYSFRKTHITKITEGY